ncbi:MAG: NAD-dependent epimerase/dehydratase family protein [Nitrospira sp.]
MRILVTGASGFLGVALVRKLSTAKHNIRAVRHDSKPSELSIPNVETVVGDICDPRRVRDITNGCQVIVHLAARVHTIGNHNVDYEAVNVEGTRHVLDAAVESGVSRVIFVSSVKVFGEETRGCVDETQALAPQTPYGRSKLRAEQLVTGYARQHGFTAVSLRLPMVYGLTRKGNLFRMLDAINRERFPILPRLSAMRSLLHVENFVQAVLLCLRAPGFTRAAYIVADSKPYCMTDLYDGLRAGLGKAPPRWRVPLWVLKAGARCGDLFEVLTKKYAPFSTDQLTKLIGDAWYSPAAITRELGYQPLYSFEKTVPELIAFYRHSIGVKP